MNRMQYRIMSMFAAGTAALAIGASPALAGSEGCAGQDCQDEDTPAQVVPAVPTPAAPSPLQAPAPAPAPESGGAAPEKASNKPAKKKRTAVRATTTRTVAQRTVPQGAVAAGAGGTAPQGPEGLLAALAGAGLVMFAAGGRLVVATRRSGS